MVKTARERTRQNPKKLDHNDEAASVSMQPSTATSGVFSSMHFTGLGSSLQKSLHSQSTRTLPTSGVSRAQRLEA